MHDLLSKAYSRESFEQFLENFLPADYKEHDQAKELPSNRKKIVTDVLFLGECSSLGDIKILEVTHERPNDPRVSLSTEIFRIMAETFTDKALVVFKNEKTSTWRLSLMTIDLSYDDVKNKVKRNPSNPRRYSFLLGPNTKIKTPHRFLIDKGEIKDFEDLASRFSVEVVNNEFYTEIAKLYDELVGTDKIRRAIAYPGSEEESHEFAVRLIGRIIFSWFLREKKSEQGLALIPHELLSRDAANTSNYYHQVLAPLFFQVLNKTPESRAAKFQTNKYRMVPYLNGGLFSNDSVDYYKFDKVLEISVPGLVKVPDEWLKRLFDLLELYNFTVDENTSFDIDLSIDPEMLGRVFENLLARINPETGETVRKSTGSFYTPREIVDYMVDASLTEYLLTKTKVDRTKLETLVSYDLSDDKGNELNNEEAVKVLNALSTLTVLDPACGSGAFPIGILQKIVFIISNLDPNAKWWLSKQLENASPELRREFENKGVDYIRKLGIIRQTIFGVDIQPIATEISRLRCFLTLIVDEVIDDNAWNRGIRPLPNLDFKFVTANTLIHLPRPEDEKGTVGEDQGALFEEISHIDELRELRNEYFTSTNHERLALQSKFSDLQRRMFIKNIDEFGGQASGEYSALSRWEPFSHKASDWFDPEWMFGIPGGFDIVIGNPPYGQLFNEDEKPQIKKLYPELKFKLDIYPAFILKGLALTNDGGCLSYIIPNTFLDNFFLDSVRYKLLNSTKFSYIADLSDKIFETVTVHSMIFGAIPSASSNDVKVYKNGYLKEYSLIPQSYFLKTPYYSIDLRNYEHYPLIEKLNINSVALKDTIDLKQTIKTGDDKKYIKSLKESPNFKPILRGRDVVKYHYRWAGLYVNYGKHLANPISPKIFEQPKILIRETGNRIIAAYDDQNYYIMSSLYDGIQKNAKFNLKYVLALLNSNLFQFLMNLNTFDKTAGAFTKARIYHYYNLPIKICEDQKPFIELADKISRKKVNGESTIQLENELNDLIYSLYDLKSEEITTIESAAS